MALGRRVSSLFPAAALAEHDEQAFQLAPYSPQSRAVGPIRQLL